MQDHYLNSFPKFDQVYAVHASLYKWPYIHKDVRQHTQALMNTHVIQKLKLCVRAVKA
jgi:ssDNA-specific exonuclease RecJ